LHSLPTSSFDGKQRAGAANWSRLATTADILETQKEFGQDFENPRSGRFQGASESSSASQRSGFAQIGAKFEYIVGKRGAKLEAEFEQSPSKNCTQLDQQAFLKAHSAPRRSTASKYHAAAAFLEEYEQKLHDKGLNARQRAEAKIFADSELKRLKDADMVCKSLKNGDLAVTAMHISGQHRRESTWTATEPGAKDEGDASEESSDYVSYLTAPLSFVTGEVTSFVTAPLTYLWGSSHSSS